MDPAIALLRELVAVNSVNPTLVPGAPGEGAIADLVAAALRRAGLDVAIEGVAHGRPDVGGVPEGRAHGSRPKEGEDAILRLGRVLARLEALDRALQAQPPHPLVGTGSLHASLVSGGRELSSYPDRATLQMERRTLPGEPESIAVAEVNGILDALVREDPTFRASATAMFSRPAYEVGRDHALPRALCDALRR